MPHIYAFFLFLALSVHLTVGSQPTLKDLFRDDFYIGAALVRSEFGSPNAPTLQLISNQFNSVTSTNILKWQPFNPHPKVFNHELADQFVDLGQKHNMYVVGHVLFWHNQTPKWVFQDQNRQSLSREKLLERMRERVRHVSTRYGRRIDAWDVVNEAVMSNGSIRVSPWSEIIGEDFIELAFRIATEELPPEIDLLYNDYSMTGKPKREAVIQMIQRLKKQGMRINGIGMQGHWSLNHPSIQAIEESIIAYAETGLDVHITELDIDVLPRKQGMFGAEVSLRLESDPSMNPYPDGLPEEIQEQLAQRYAEIFELFLKHREKIKRVTFWGTTDQYYWLNNWPIKGRTSYPLLFDRQGMPKPAFKAVTQIKSPNAK